MSFLCKQLVYFRLAISSVKKSFVLLRVSDYTLRLLHVVFSKRLYMEQEIVPYGHACHVLKKRQLKK